MRVQEAIMTTGISLEMVINRIEDGKLNEILTKRIEAESCIYQTTLDVTAALNRIIWGNSVVVVPHEPVDNHVVVDVNGTIYDLMTGKKVESEPIKPDRLTADTYAIEDEIRIICRPGALGDE